jgi:hypothetical protein
MDSRGLIMRWKAEIIGKAGKKYLVNDFKRLRRLVGRGGLTRNFVATRRGASVSS